MEDILDFKCWIETIFSVEAQTLLYVTITLDILSHNA